MRFLHAFICGALLIAGQAHAASAPDHVSKVQRSYVPKADVRQVAVIPVKCPKEVECAEFEEVLSRLVTEKTKLAVTGAAQVRELMQTANIKKVDVEARYILAESLRVDGFILCEIEAAGTDVAEPKMIKMGMSYRHNPERVTFAKLNLKVMKKDGTELLAGKTEARVGGMFRSVTSVTRVQWKIC